MECHECIHLIEHDSKSNQPMNIATRPENSSPKNSKRITTLPSLNSKEVKEFHHIRPSIKSPERERSKEEKSLEFMEQQDTLLKREEQESSPMETMNSTSLKTFPIPLENRKLSRHSSSLPSSYVRTSWPPSTIDLSSSTHFNSIQEEEGKNYRSAIFNEESKSGLVDSNSDSEFSPSSALLISNQSSTIKKEEEKECLEKNLLLDYKKLFPELEDEELLHMIPCSLKKEVSIYGKLYVTFHHVCFYSPSSDIKVSCFSPKNIYMRFILLLLL
jgi:hypothetical protein